MAAARAWVGCSVALAVGGCSEPADTEQSDNGVTRGGPSAAVVEHDTRLGTGSAIAPTSPLSCPGAALAPAAWELRFDTPVAIAEAFVADVEFARSGALFAAGVHTGSFGSADPGSENGARFVARFAPNGELSWVRRYPVKDLLSIASDGAEGVVVAAGGLYGAEAKPRTVLERLDCSGNALWKVTCASCDLPSPAVAVSPAGNVYLASRYAGRLDFGAESIEPSNWEALFVAGFDGGGAHLWTRSFEEQDDGEPLLVTRPSSVILAIGARNATFGLIPNGTASSGGSGDLDISPKVKTTDAHVLALDEHGASTWVTRFERAEQEWPTTLGVVDGGDLLIGYGQTSQFVARLDAQGSVVWDQLLGENASVMDGSLAAGALEVAAIAQPGADFGFGPLTEKRSVAVSIDLAAGTTTSQELLGKIGDDVYASARLGSRTAVGGGVPPGPSDGLGRQGFIIVK